MRSLIDFLCEEKIEGYSVLPPFIDRRLTPARKKTLTHGLVRAWAGDDICEQLAVPDNRLRYLVPAARPFVTAYDTVRRRLPGYDPGAAAERSLQAFSGALKLEAGDPEIAPAADVLAGFTRHEQQARRMLDEGRYL
jgi:hypothetical protein